jgi:hypothetical protein
MSGTLTALFLLPSLFCHAPFNGWSMEEAADAYAAGRWIAGAECRTSH